MYWLLQKYSGERTYSLKLFKFDGKLTEAQKYVIEYIKNNPKDFRELLSDFELYLYGDNDTNMEKLNTDFFKRLNANNLKYCDSFDVISNTLKESTFDELYNLFFKNRYWVFNEEDNEGYGFYLQEIELYE